LLIVIQHKINSERLFEICEKAFEICEGVFAKDVVVVVFVLFFASDALLM
jgi:hypothetical protein